MKKQIKPFLLPAAVVTLYLFCLVIGAFAGTAYSVHFQQKDILYSLANRASLAYLENDISSLDQLLTSDTHIYFYDGQGTRILNLDPVVALPSSNSIPLEQYLPHILAGKTVYRSLFVWERTDIIVVAGIPLYEQGDVCGAVFLVRNLKNLPEAIIGFAVYFTVFYWLSALVILANARKSRKLDQLRRNYIANVTHALKTPTASIKALAETLCDGVEPDPDQQKVYYGMILHEANRQDRMIRDILELSKLQSSGMDFSKTSAGAAQVFQPVLDKYAALCDCMEISLHVSPELSRLPSLHTNAACLRQLLELLLDNALKFVPEGGDIWLEAAQSGRTVTFCVRDNGVGIDKEFLPHVFERFFKGSHDFNASGSGLGLAIAKEIATGLKEKLWVESELGKGAAFYFTAHLK